MAKLSPQARAKAEAKIVRRAKAAGRKKARAEKAAAKKEARAAAKAAKAAARAGGEAEAASSSGEASGEASGGGAAGAAAAPAAGGGEGAEEAKGAEPGPAEAEEEEEEDSDFEDGAYEEADTDEEDEHWAPPEDLEAYAKTQWGDRATHLAVRVLSVSHLPAGGGGDDDGGGGGGPGGGADAKAAVECELFGAPCDARKWAPSAEVGNDGMKHIFDAALCADVAEPRLALLRLAVLRAGAPVAQTVVPVHLMRPGLRWVQLYDPSSHSEKVTESFLMTRLLVYVASEPYGTSHEKKVGFRGKALAAAKAGASKAGKAAKAGASKAGKAAKAAKDKAKEKAAKAAGKVKRSSAAAADSDNSDEEEAAPTPGASSVELPEEAEDALTAEFNRQKAAKAAAKA